MRTRALDYIVGAIFLAALPMAAAAQTGSMPATNATGTVAGTVVSRTPDTIVIGTENHGVMEFAITKRSSIPLDIENNNYVELDYRSVPEGGRSEVISIRHVAMKSNTATSPAPAAKAPSAPTGNAATSGTMNSGEAGASTGMQPMASQKSSGTTSTPKTSAAPSKLPQTASSLPLIGLVGLLASGGAVASRFLLKG